MKSSTYSDIMVIIEEQLDNVAEELRELMGDDNLKAAILNIYMCSDLVYAFGQDYVMQDFSLDTGQIGRISLISTRYSISLIIGNVSSSFKYDMQICLYVDMEDDIATIILVLNAAFDRLNSRR